MNKQTGTTYISESASNMTTPSHKSDRSSGGFVTEKKTALKNSQMALARGSSSASAMVLRGWLCWWCDSRVIRLCSAGKIWSAAQMPLSSERSSTRRGSKRNGSTSEIRPVQIIDYPSNIRRRRRMPNEMRQRQRQSAVSSLALVLLGLGGWWMQVDAGGCRWMRWTDVGAEVAGGRRAAGRNGGDWFAVGGSGRGKGGGEAGPAKSLPRVIN